MMMLVAALIGGLGLVSMISRKTMMGLLIGVHLLVLGSTMMFVLAGLAAGMRVDGYIFGLFITLAGVAELVVGYALAIRLFFLKKKISIDDLQELKQ